LLVVFLLLAQLGRQSGALALQLTQLAFFIIALARPLLGSSLCRLALPAEQLALAT
jgi:hypothetical protein